MKALVVGMHILGLYVKCALYRVLGTSDCMSVCGVPEDRDGKAGDVCRAQPQYEHFTEALIIFPRTPGSEVPCWWARHTPEQLNAYTPASCCLSSCGLNMLLLSVESLVSYHKESIKVFDNTL